MSFHATLANALIGTAILVIIIAVFYSNKLISVLQKSKVEGFWKRSRILLIILGVLFFLIMITRLIGDGSAFTANLASGPNHAIIMNATFLITSLLFLSLVRLDIQTFESLFSILKKEQQS